MRTAQLLSAIRSYDEAKERLAKARKDMDSVIAYVKSSIRRAETGMLASPFRFSDEFIVRTISEMKKAHAAWEDLFVDHEMQHQIDLLNTGIRARAEFHQLIAEKGD
jgi:hypothetical protein